MVTFKYSVLEVPFRRFYCMNLARLPSFLTRCWYKRHSTFCILFARRCAAIRCYLSCGYAMMRKDLWHAVTSRDTQRERERNNLPAWSTRPRGSCHDKVRVDWIEMPIRYHRWDVRWTSGIISEVIVWVEASFARTCANEFDRHCNIEKDHGKLPDTQSIIKRRLDCYNVVRWCRNDWERWFVHRAQDIACVRNIH